MSGPLMLDVIDTSYLLGVGRDATYSAFVHGELPAIRVGRAWRVPAHRLAAEVLGCTVDDIVAALEDRDRAATQTGSEQIDAEAKYPRLA